MSIQNCTHCHSRPCFNENGRIHPFCGKTCAAAAAALKSQSCCSVIYRSFAAVIGTVQDICRRIGAIVARVLGLSSPLQPQLNYLSQLANQGRQIDFYKKDETNPMAPMSLTAFLGNFHESPILIDGAAFPCSEALYQAAKFIRPNESVNSPYNRTIIEKFCNGAINPSQVGHSSWQIGQDLPRLGFAPRPDWKRNNVAIMTNILRLKYDQNPLLKTFLRATGSALLNERTDRDSFWGDGANRQGENQLGKCHQRLRDEMNQNNGTLTSIPFTLTDALLFN